MLSQKLVLSKSKNFTSSSSLLMPPTVPINHYGDSRNQQNRTARPILLFHANVFGRLACFEHSNFLKVKVLVPRRTQRRARRFTKRKSPPRQYSAVRRTARTSSKFNYELFNCNNFNIRYWSWNYRGCWHQTCPPIVPRCALYLLLIPIAVTIWRRIVIS